MLRNTQTYHLYKKAFLFPSEMNYYRRCSRPCWAQKAVHTDELEGSSHAYVKVQREPGAYSK